MNNNAYDKPTAREIARFWSKVNKIDDETSCWEWTGYCSSPGKRGRYNAYGYFAREKDVSKGRVGGMTLAHRYSMELQTGGPIPDGMVVMHQCDNPKCVRPDHLRVATQQENMQDAIRKGIYKPRAAKTRRKPSIHLSPEQRAECLATCTTGTEAEEKYGIDPATFRRWKRLGLPGGNRRQYIRLNEDQIAEALATCKTGDEAEAKYGVHPTTYYRWLRNATGSTQQPGA